MMVWLNDEWKEEGDAAVAASDGAFLRGEGVFETMLARGGQVFELGRHWERLERSCDRLGIEIFALESALPVFEELFERNSFPTKTRVRVRVTRSRESLLFSAQESKPYPEKLSLLSSPFQRNERSALTGIKAISYAENLAALEDGKRRGADEVLFANTRGQWCEGAWSNIFAVEDGCLWTPPLSSGCLPGITREVVLELAGCANLFVQEKERTMESLKGVEEMFLTSSLLGIGAVHEFDGRVLTSGEVTQQLAQRLVERENQH